MSAHEVNPSELSTAERYRLMTSIVTPRPIAWVSTVDGTGRGNLAPFSYFQAMCSTPPTVVIGIGSKADGTPKDTLRNILETHELTINHVSEGFALAMNESSADYAPEISEWDALGLTAEASRVVKPPRVAGVRAALECRLTHAIPIGLGNAGGPSSTMVVAEVVHFVIAQGLLRRDSRGRLEPLDSGSMATVGRLGGIGYNRTTDRFEIPRPVLPEPK